MALHIDLQVTPELKAYMQGFGDGLTVIAEAFTEAMERLQDKEDEDKGCKGEEIPTREG